jgi:hypothetical protein
MQIRWLTLILLLTMSCSDGRTGGNAVPAQNDPAKLADGRPRDGTPPSAQAIIAAEDCEPPPCDDVGACARLPIAEVRELQCLVGPSGDTARCSFRMIPGFGSRQDRLRRAERVAFSLRRRGGDSWCIGS